jgi:hypothetical protein
VCLTNRVCRAHETTQNCFCNEVLCHVASSDPANGVPFVAHWQEPFAILQEHQSIISAFGVRGPRKCNYVAPSVKICDLIDSFNICKNRVN